MRLAHPAALVLAALSTPASGSAPDDPESFLHRAREATATYRDRSAAIADGYRRIGEDFPGMGEHWIHIGRVFDGRVEAERPEVLSYATTPKGVELTGVAWIVPLLEGEVAPDFPAPAALWHEHRGSLDDETTDPRHDRPGSGDGPRLAMLHGWVWLDNPDGPFAADNWALPWHRLGLARPADAPAAAGRALSLLGPTADYWRAVVEAGAGERGEEALAVLSEARGRCESLLDEDPPARAGRLARLWGELAGRLGSLAGGRLEETLSGSAHPHPH